MKTIDKFTKTKIITSKTFPNSSFVQGPKSNPTVAKAKINKTISNTEY